MSRLLSKDGGNVSFERYTLSSLLNRMMEVEKIFTSHLTKLIDSMQENSSLKLRIKELINSSEKRMSNIEWIKSYVVEMTLEPITNINLDKYLNRMNIILCNKEYSSDMKLKYLIENQKLLYDEVSDAIKHISLEAAELFRSYSKKLDKLFIP